MTFHFIIYGFFYKNFVIAGVIGCYADFITQTEMLRCEKLIFIFKCRMYGGHSVSSSVSDLSDLSDDLQPTILPGGRGGRVYEISSY